MNRTIKKVALGSAFALFAGSTLTGVASAAPGSASLGSGSLGATAPEFESPYTLAEPSACDVNYFGEPYNEWEINWGSQYEQQHHTGWDSQSFGGLTYIDSQFTNGQYADETPAQTLFRVQSYDANPAHSQNFHWFQPTREMVSNGTELTLGFADGDVILGEAMVGSDFCPSVRWTHFPPEGEPDTITPETFPEDAPAPSRPTFPTDEASPTGSLASLFGS